MMIVLVGVGATGFGKGPNVAWASGSLLIVFSFLYQFTVGPVCYCLVAEIPSTRLRAKVSSFFWRRFCFQTTQRTLASEITDCRTRT